MRKLFLLHFYSMKCSFLLSYLGLEVVNNDGSKKVYEYKDQIDSLEPNAKNNRKEFSFKKDVDNLPPPIPEEESETGAGIKQEDDSRTSGILKKGEEDELNLTQETDVSNLVVSSETHRDKITDTQGHSSITSNEIVDADSFVMLEDKESLEQQKDYQLWAKGINCIKLLVGCKFILPFALVNCGLAYTYYKFSEHSLGVKLTVGLIDGACVLYYGKTLLEQKCSDY